MIFPALSNVAGPSAQKVVLRVSANAEKNIRRGHPWVFEKSILKQSRRGAPGELAVLFDAKRKFLAIGLYDPTSPIRVRILQSGKPAVINSNWFQEKIHTASALRQPLNAPHTNGYRLVHGENDGLPGLVVDRYADALVVKLYTPAWIPYLQEICGAFPFYKHIVLRFSRSVQKQTAALQGLADGSMLTSHTPPSAILFKENGIIFECDPINGQKTGFFLDQRENRERIRNLSQHKTVLNVFSYTGGFSLYAAAGGAKTVTSVDLSLPATQAVLRNIKHNQQLPEVRAAKFETLTEDAFKALTEMNAGGRKFDLVILDPPMFAQNQTQAEAALSAYRRLTQLGLSVLKSGGILAQTSCSSRVSAERFFESIHQAAQAARRPLQEIERTGHALDHPIAFKEGAYLKCLFAIA